MLRIVALYPNTPGSRFDLDYYVGRHTPFAKSMLEEHGLRAIRTVAGTAALDGGAPVYWAISEMEFDTRAAFDAAMAACGEALFADLPNYTDTTPILQVGDLQTN